MKVKTTGPHNNWRTDGEVVESNKPRPERLVLTATDGCNVIWDNMSPTERLVRPSAVPIIWVTGYFLVNPNRRMVAIGIPPRVRF